MILKLICTVYLLVYFYRFGYVLHIHTHLSVSEAVKANQLNNVGLVVKRYRDFQGQVLHVKCRCES